MTCSSRLCLLVITIYAQKVDTGHARLKKIGSLYSVDGKGKYIFALSVFVNNYS